MTGNPKREAEIRYVQQASQEFAQEKETFKPHILKEPLSKVSHFLTSGFTKQ